MCQIEPPPEYWKALAEERREALSEALDENAQLHTSITELKEENRRLSEAGEKLAKFILEVAGNESSTDTQDSSDADETHE
jgi:TRAP-type C4-dicarboxylate transport system substrate-binding protein